MSLGMDQLGRNQDLACCETVTRYAVAFENGKRSSGPNTQPTFDVRNHNPINPSWQPNVQAGGPAMRAAWG